VLECEDEACRYGPGPEIGHTNVYRARQMLTLLGIEQKRLVEKRLQAHEKEELVKELWGFAETIHQLGQDPAKPIQERVAI
jgi:coenzyme F420-reducing hydrogenase delta subunit